MAKKKNPTPSTRAEEPLEATDLGMIDLDVLSEQQHQAHRPVEATFFDVTDLDVSPLLRAAGDFLRTHELYRGFVTGAGRDSDRVMPLLEQVRASAGALQQALAAAGVVINGISRLGAWK
jgi:hypothetical protein